VPEIIGFDGWLHIKMADLIRHEGFINPAPYSTILVDTYADNQLGFRILLIPFTFLGLIHGAKIASILFASAAFTIFYWYLRKNNSINYPFFWTAAYAFASYDLLYRFLEPRAMPLAILSLVLTLFFIEKRMYKSIFILSLLFGWLYYGFVFQLFIISVFLAIDYLKKRKLDINLILYPIAGIALSIVINPYFPASISHLYTQLFQVNLVSNLYNAEWKSWGILDFIKFNWIYMLLYLTSVGAIIRNQKFDKKQLGLFIISTIFLVAMLKTRRMHEYFAPFSVLFAAFCLGNKENNSHARYISVAALVLISLFSLVSLNEYIHNNHFLPWYKEGADFLRTLPEGSKVFINAYTYTYFFFYNPSLEYTHGIDLTYSYLKDPQKFERYISVLQGKDPGINIVKDYDANYAVIGKIRQDINLFDYMINYQDDFELIYEDKNLGILRVK